VSADRTGLKPMKPSRRLPVQFTLASLWLVFTLALAGWWLQFGLSQLGEIELILQSHQGNSSMDSSTHHTRAEEVKRRHRMLLSEGLVLFALLLGGGVAILYSLSRESGRARRVEEFFAAFSHDLKTSLASLRLQSESLAENWQNGNRTKKNGEQGSVDSDFSRDGKILNRILGDVARLETQLENALYVAESDRLGQRQNLLIEQLNWRTIIQSIAPLWPKLRFTIQGDAWVMGDRRSLETVVRNIAQNAIKHGNATELRIELEEVPSSGSGSEGRVRARFSDDGRGFAGDREKLGEIFSRQSGTGGSGLGLYLIAQLLRGQKGDVRVPSSGPTGFVLEVILPSGRGQ